MIQMFLSSGDLIADRRADYARMFGEAHDFASAADVMRQALDLVPAWAAGWFALGSYAEKAGDREAAGEAYRQVLRLTESDIFGAGLKLAMLGRASVPPIPPSAFVERLFDDYASRFDRALVERLAYTVPEQLSALIAGTHGGGFAHAVDLGCGTGLMGERLRSRASYMEGYDLSSGMLSQAREKGIYDHLATLDLAVAPHPDRLPLSGRDKADLVTAADVLIYLGDLDTVFATAAAILDRGGLFAFSVERGPAESDWILQPSLRYCHGEGYVHRLAERHGFAVKAATTGVIRRDGADAITGMLFVLEQQNQAAAVLADGMFPVAQSADETLTTH